ncbi:hypothetical protein [Achromobacter sp. DH1f]|uniref:hypothetical protein n=1 Tax=Achromobacter sp. DH1f TaxID=1397275 RepID=UPI0012FEC8C1|nr:hypothetical protein [Achromobacter sp. DH1f]
MSCSPRQLLAAATSIGIKGNTEALHRATASRAYYAAYHAAKAYHDRLASPGSVAYAKGGMHEVLHTQLRYPTVADAKAKAESRALGNLLMAVYALRVNADYKPEQDFLATAGLAALEKASTIIEAINQVHA